MNHYNPNIHHRRSIRLKGYDYSKAGLYYITICVQDRECLFGKIEKCKMILNDAGNMVTNEWLKIPGRFPYVQLHQYVVMPNHFHAIMEITVGATLVVAPMTTVAPIVTVAPDIDNQTAFDNRIIDNQTAFDNRIVDNQTAFDDQTAPENVKRATTRVAPTVGNIVGAFQSIVTVNYIRGVKNHKWPSFNGKLWQRNYWEHIIRDENSYCRISDYILNNPANWHKDKFNH
jgi:REP element-mobilizing transposase RayT